MLDMEPKQLISQIGNNQLMKLRKNNGLNGGMRDIDMKDKDKIENSSKLRRRSKKKNRTKRRNDYKINIIKCDNYYNRRYYYLNSKYNMLL